MGQEQDNPLHKLLLKPEELNLSEVEQADIAQLLSNPQVRKYFRILMVRNLLEFFDNEAETDQQKEELAARFNKLKGVQYFCTFLLNNFQPVVPKQEKKT